MLRGGGGLWNFTFVGWRLRRLHYDWSYPSRHTPSLSVCPVQKGGGETPGRLFATYADLMTEIMIVTSYCGSLSTEFTPGGWGVGLWSIQYHKNLHNTPCGSKLSTYKKQFVKYWEYEHKNLKNTLILAAGKIKCYTFWDQNHYGLSVKKSNRYFLYIIDAFWAKKRFYQMWHLLGSKSCLIIGQQSRNIVRYYMRIISKIATSRRGVGAHLWGRGGGHNPPALGKPFPPHTHPVLAWNIIF